VCDEYGYYGRMAMNAAASAAASQALCTSSTFNGTWSAEPCTRTNAVFGCETITIIANACAEVTTSWFYPPFTVADEQQNCMPPGILVSPNGAVVDSGVVDSGGESKDATTGSKDATASSDASTSTPWLLSASATPGSCPGLDPGIDVNQNGISDCVENLLQNGQFSTAKGTAPWVPGTNNGTSASITFSPTDEHHFPGSGSAVEVNIVPSTTVNGGSVVSECVMVPKGATCNMYMRYFMASRQPGGDTDAATWITVDEYSDGACTENAAGDSGGSLGQTKDAWDTYTRINPLLGVTNSIKIELGVLKGATGSGVQATFDNVLLVCK
jgi:hypothetical protein